MSVLGNGLFSKIIESPESKQTAVKIIEVDDQKPPHNWRAEIAALNQLAGQHNVVPLLNYTTSLEKMDPQVRIEMPKYEMTLENVIYHYAKANYPPGSGWRNAMPLSRVREILLGVSEALESIHSKGIIHRDLKPENIMFTSFESTPVLIDFGISWVPTVSNETEPENDRHTDVSTGEYKAPELLFGVRSYTNKVDIWALGCILARLLGPDCNPLFSPYRSDIALIGSQLKTLGRPNMEECPTLQNSVAQSMLSHLQTQTSRNLPLRSFNDDSTKIVEILDKLLDYESTKRPAASEIIAQI